MSQAPMPTDVVPADARPAEPPPETRGQRVKKFLFEKMFGPVLMLLLTGIFLMLAGFIPQLSYLEKRVTTLQSELDKRLTEVGKVDKAVEDAKKALEPMPAKLDGLATELREKDKEFKKTLGSLDDKARELAAALNVKGDELALLKQAVAFVRNDRARIEALGRIAALETRPNCEKHRIYLDESEPGKTVCEERPATDTGKGRGGAIEHKLSTSNGRTYTFTVPLTSSAVGPYEVFTAVSMTPSTSSFLASRSYVEVVSKREKDFVLKVNVWGINNPEFYVDCLVLRQ